MEGMCRYFTVAICALIDTVTRTHTHFSVCSHHIQLKQMYLDWLNEKPIQCKIPGSGKIFFSPIKMQQRSETDPSEDNIHAKFQGLPWCGGSNAEK